MRFTLFCAALIAGSTLSAEPVQGFDPTQPCGDVIAQAQTPAGRAVVAAWVLGFLAEQDGSLYPVNDTTANILFHRIAKACSYSDQQPFHDMVRHAGPAGDADHPGSLADARAVLSEFLRPGADLAALTQALLPTDEAIRAVYTEPLASQIIAMYQAANISDEVITPKPGQSELLVVHTTTGALQNGAPALREFPGGYQKVLSYFQADVPIVRFKFVRPGKSMGMAYDGLVYLDGRWVWLPKPWRALSE